MAAYGLACSAFTLGPSLVPGSVSLQRVPPFAGASECLTKELKTDDATEEDHKANSRDGACF